MATTQAAVATLAMRHLGVSTTITALTATDTASSVMNDFYTTALEELLRDFPWPHATRIEDLDHVVIDPNDEWANSYRIPSDCLKIRRIFSGDRPEDRSIALPYRRVKDKARTISAITKANPGVVTTSTVHYYTAGDQIYIRSVGGMTEVSDALYTVGTVNSTTTFNLQTSAAVNINTTAYTTFTSGGTTQADDLILTDEGDATTVAAIEYTALVDNPTFYPPDFTMALSYRLAFYAAPSIAESEGLVELMAKLWKMSGEKAMANAANEEMPDIEPQSSWITGR
jgi:hypothetical protein